MNHLNKSDAIDNIINTLGIEISEDYNLTIFYTSRDNGFVMRTSLGTR